MDGKEYFVSLEKPFEALKRRAREADPRRKRRYIVHFTLFLAVVIALLVLSSQINHLIEAVIDSFYTAQPIHGRDGFSIPSPVMQPR
jgi:hypothetical protein